jgi:hypothetical protein
MGQNPRPRLRRSRRVIAIDTNILVHAHREDAPWHDAAAAAISGVAEGKRPGQSPGHASMNSWRCDCDQSAHFQDAVASAGCSGADRCVARVTDRHPPVRIRRALAGVARVAVGWTCGRAARARRSRRGAVSGPRCEGTVERRSRLRPFPASRASQPARQLRAQIMGGEMWHSSERKNRKPSKYSINRCAARYAAVTPSTRARRSSTARSHPSSISNRPARPARA